MAGRATAWFREEDVTGLALLRVGVAILIGLSPEVLTGVALDSIGPALRTPQEGLGWFAAHAPVSFALVNGARLITAITALTGALGLFSRASFGVLATVGLYLFAVAELVGATRHNMHLFWFAALLAVSPCGAAMSLDAVRRRARRDGLGVVPPVDPVAPVGPVDPVAPFDPLDVTCALWAARALLGIVYFFPGYWKLRESGFAWALSDNLQNQMYWKWYQNAWLPPVRIDLHPMFIRGGALGVLLLELGFPFLVLSRRGRLVAVMGGLAFHLFAEQFMRLGFASLWWCYVVLVDFRPIVAWLHDETGTASRPQDTTAQDTAAQDTTAQDTTAQDTTAQDTTAQDTTAQDTTAQDTTAQDTTAQDTTAQDTTARATLAGLLRRRVVVVGALLFLANAVQGFRGAVQAWPFACYPTFQYRVGKEMPDLVVAAVDANGRESVVLDGTRGVKFRAQRDWGIVWRLLGVYGGGANERGLRAYYERADGARRPPDGTRALRFYRAEFDTSPERRGGPAVDRTLMLEFPP